MAGKAKVSEGKVLVEDLRDQDYIIFEGQVREVCVQGTDPNPAGLYRGRKSFVILERGEKLPLDPGTIITRVPKPPTSEKATKVADQAKKWWEFWK